MLQGLEILLARAKEFPEEFIPDVGRWRRLIDRVWGDLTEEEQQILTAALNEARRTWFNAAVLEELASPNAEVTLKLGSGPFVKGVGPWGYEPSEKISAERQAARINVAKALNR